MNVLTRGEVNDQIAAQAHKDLDMTQDAADVTRWRRLAFALIEGAEAWSFLHAYGEITLVADQYEYSLPDDLQRIDADSIGYDGSDSAVLAFFDSVTEIDRMYGRKWKRSGADGDTPRYAAIMGTKLWIAPKPNSTFVSSYPTLDFYYYKAIDPDNSTSNAQGSDDDTTALNAPTWTMPYILWAAGQFSQAQEDNPDWQLLMGRFRSELVPEMRTFDVSVFTDEPLMRPRVTRIGGSRRGYRWGY